MNYDKQFRVKSGQKIQLKHFDPQFAAKQETKKSANERVAVSALRREQALAFNLPSGARRWW